MTITCKAYIEKTFSFLLDMIYPPRCPVCDGICDEVGKVCDKCQNVFFVVKQPRCLKCGKELVKYENEFCLDCSKHPKNYIKGFPLWNYDNNVRRSVAAFKYHNKKEYGRYYAKSICEVFQEDFEKLNLDVIIPVPVHSSKLKIRGYNQARILADEISKIIGVPVLDGFLVRNRKTLPQKELSDLERLKNLCQAFETNKENDIIKSNNIKNVLLVDDIYTTGSTIEACTVELLNVGVHKVYYTSVCIGKGYI